MEKALATAVALLHSCAVTLNKSAGRDLLPLRHAISGVSNFSKWLAITKTKTAKHHGANQKSDRPRLEMLINVGSASSFLEDFNLPDEVKAIRRLANVVFHGSTCRDELQGGSNKTIWLVAFHAKRNFPEFFRQNKFFS